MGVDAYLIADGDRPYLYLGRAYHTDGKDLRPRSCRTLEDMNGPDGASAREVEALGIDMMRRAQEWESEEDDYAGRHVVAYAQAFPDATIRRRLDISPDVPPDDAKEWTPSIDDLDDVDDSCPTCGHRPGPSDIPGQPERARRRPGKARGLSRRGTE